MLIITLELESFSLLKKINVEAMLKTTVEKSCSIECVMFYLQQAYLSFRGRTRTATFTELAIFIDILRRVL